MAKVKLGAKPYLYPMPVVLVGAQVQGKPNYLTVAFVGITNLKPPVIGLGLGREHYTSLGIRKNKTFSVNLPSPNLVKATDYCGIYSGHRVDKSRVFKSFYGKLKTAPMIEECPLSMECKLIRIIPFEVDELILGEIVEVYADKQCLSNGAPDVKKLKPMMFTFPDNRYWTMGKPVGPAWKIGKTFPGKVK